MYPNDGVTIVWAPVLFYYTQRQHDHLNTATSPHQATSRDDEGSRRTSSSISSLRKKAQTTRDASFGPLVSFFKIILCCFLILTSIVLRFSNVPNRRDPVLCITHSQHDNTTTTTTLPRHHHTMPPPPPRKHLQGPNDCKTVVRAQYLYFYIYIYIYRYRHIYR